MEVSGVTSSAAAGTQTAAPPPAAASGSDFSTVLSEAAGGTVMNAPALEVVYLDGSTGQSKTGYVVGDTLYEDAAGQVPASDYSEFRKSDGILYVQTPYGTLRKTEFGLLLRKQQQYDAQTFGQPVWSSDGELVGTVKGEGNMTAPLTSYTSAPNGPGTVSAEIWSEHYSQVVGTIAAVTVEEVLPAGEASGDGTVVTQSSGSESTPTVQSAGPATGTSAEAAATAVGGSADDSAVLLSAGTSSGTTTSELDAAVISARVAANRRALLQQYINAMLLDEDRSMLLDEDR